MIPRVRLDERQYLFLIRLQQCTQVVTIVQLIPLAINAFVMDLKAIHACARCSELVILTGLI
jgi:hypothetical protein